MTNNEDKLVVLNENQEKVLKNIYVYRHLSYEQIMQITYLNQSSNETEERRLTSRLINQLLELNFIEESTSTKNRKAYNLTRYGIDYLLNIEYLNANRFNFKTNKTEKDYFTASQLKMNPMILEHQLNLNQFVLDFKDMVEKTNPNFEYEYLDEKNVSQTYMFQNDVVNPKNPKNVQYSMKPDGMLRFKDVDIILEIDRGTESKAKLLTKWKKYANYFQSSKNSERVKPFFVLFVLTDTRNIGDDRFDNQKAIVLRSMYESIYELTREGFDIAVGEQDYCLNILKNKFLTDDYEKNKLNLKNILEDRFCAKVTSVEKLVSNVDNKHDYEFGMTLYETSERDKVVNNNGRNERFLITYKQHNSFKEISNVYYHYIFQKKLLEITTRNYIKNKYKEPLNTEQKKKIFKAFEKQYEFYQIVVVDSLEDAYIKTNMAEINNSIEIDLREERNEPKGIYYTTINDLLNAPTIYEALYQFDRNGKIKQINDSTFLNIKRIITL